MHTIIISMDSHQLAVYLFGGSVFYGFPSASSVCLVDLFSMDSHQLAVDLFGGSVFYGFPSASSGSVFVVVYKEVSIH